MEKQESKEWRFIIMVIMAVLTLPILAILTFLIFDKFDLSQPRTWLVMAAFVVLMFWDNIAKKTYQPRLKRFLSKKSRFLRFFIEEIERIGFLWLFLIAALLANREEDFFLFENPFHQAASILGMLIVFSAFWALGRVWFAYRRDAKRNQHKF